MRHLFQNAEHDFGSCRDFLLQTAVRPALERHGRRHERQIVAPERAVVLAGPENVMFRLDQRHGHGQPVAADRLGQADDVRVEPRLLEAEERARASATGLDVVDDQQDFPFAADGFEPFQPLEAGGVDAPLALHRLHDHGRGQVQAAAAVCQHGLEQVESIHVLAHITVEGQPEDTVERHARPLALHGVAGHRQRAQRHAVKGVREGHHVFAAGDEPRQLQGAFHRVGAGGPRKQHLVGHPAGFEDHLVEPLQEGFLGLRRHVQPVGHPVACDILDQRILHVVGIVAVIQRAGAGEEIHVFPAVPVPDPVILGLAEHLGEGTRIAAYIRFEFFKDGHGIAILGL